MAVRLCEVVPPEEQHDAPLMRSGAGMGFVHYMHGFGVQEAEFSSAGENVFASAPPPMGTAGEQLRSRTMAWSRPCPHGGGASGRQGGEPPVGGPDPESRLTAPIGADRV